MGVCSSKNSAIADYDNSLKNENQDSRNQEIAFPTSLRVEQGKSNEPVVNMIESKSNAPILSIQQMALCKLSEALGDCDVDMVMLDENVTKSTPKKPNLFININTESQLQESHIDENSQSKEIKIGSVSINQHGLKAENKSKQNNITRLGCDKSDFAIIKKLGKGASATVMEAIHIPTLTIVAIKVLSINDEGNLAVMHREIEILKKNMLELEIMSEDNAINSFSRGESRLPQLKSKYVNLIGMHDGRDC